MDAHSLQQTCFISTPIPPLSSFATQRNLNGTSGYIPVAAIETAWNITVHANIIADEIICQNQMHL